MTETIRFLLSGNSEAGKSTLLLQLVKEAKSQNIDIRGVISPAVFSGNEKIGIDLFDIRTGCKVRLATLNHQHSESIIATEHWLFNPTNLALGNTILAESTPCDLLVIDELGPIELERGQGWQNGLKAIDSGLFKLAVLVIRPSLILTAQTRWPDAKVISLNNKDAAEQKAIIEAILSKLNN